MILSITLNPAVDHALFVDGLKIGDTNRVQHNEIDAGGKGINLSRVAVELGAMSVAVGFLGGGTGAFVRQVMARQGVLHDFVEVQGETRTNFSVEDGSGGPATTFNEKGPTIDEASWGALIDKVRHYAARSRWVAMGGSLPGGIPAEAYRILCDVVKEEGAKVVLDADGEPMRLGIQAHPDFIKPNAHEAERLLGDGRKIENLDQALQAAAMLRTGHEISVVSAGEQGAVMACDSGLFRGFTPKVAARSTIGSGDSLIAGILAGLEQGQEIERAFAWGLAAGAATAMTDGSEIARRPVFDLLLPQAIVERVD
jgi:1-phosphofructokinase family hexose kinase